MAEPIASRPDHGDSIAEETESPPTVGYNLFFDDVEFALNSILGDSLNLSGFAYTVATVPDAADNPSSIIFVTDESGGAVPAFSRGSNWRRVTDGAVIS